MTKISIAALFASAALSAGCGGGSFGGSGSASYSASASVDIKVPIAQMPPKYASWVVEADGYLFAVNDAYSRHTRATADLAAALGVQANADAIANFIRDAIQVESTLVCTPPSFNAGLVSQCTANANAQASGSAGNGGAHGDAAAGIQANCKAKASLSLTPGSCTLETTVTEHPILSDRARWATIEANMKIILQLDAANAHLDGRGAGINSRGLNLYVQSVTDLASEPSLVLQLNKIQAELKKGAEATGEANDKQAAMNGNLGTMTGAIEAQFPTMRAAVVAS